MIDYLRAYQYSEKCGYGKNHNRLSGLAPNDLYSELERAARCIMSGVEFQDGDDKLKFFGLSPIRLGSVAYADLATALIAIDAAKKGAK